MRTRGSERSASETWSTFDTFISRYVSSIWIQVSLLKEQSDPSLGLYIKTPGATCFKTRYGHLVAHSLPRWHEGYCL